MIINTEFSNHYTENFLTAYASIRRVYEVKTVNALLYPESNTNEALLWKWLDPIAQSSYPQHSLQRLKMHCGIDDQRAAN